MENKRVPKVRFAEFSGEWMTRSLSELVDRVKSYSLSRSVEVNNFTGYKYIHYGDIHTKVATVIDEGSVLPNIEAGDYDFLLNGDLVLADASEDYQGIATPSVVTINTPYKLIAGLHTIALRPKTTYSLFLYYMFFAEHFRRYGYKVGTGMKVFGISVTNILRYEVGMPCQQEQTKIGNFFKQLDEAITLQQQELDSLKQTKQGFLQKLFPKEGESLPEVRFPDFSGEWEKNELGELMSVGSVKRIHQADWTSNGIRFFRARDIVAKFKGEEIKEFLYISEERYNKYAEASGKVLVGDLLVTGVGTIGVPMLIENNDPIYFKDGNIIWFKNKNNLDGYFLYYSFVNNEIQKFVHDVAGTGTVGTYTIENGKRTPILFPSKQEQTKIGNFFKQLDDTIALHEKELETLKETKKAFLQKMFV
ncbi:type I restriction-modification system, specificity subunit S [Geomicrobium sp. JCM 19037]|uniref:restriction endonuclease subunit S n=1 Tax=Geomicrobium sp. JCM 19037 TaxID=1460634 RepID=UPI00045F154C|nr:restriction endonuclease subunit S [Geomicrobium sp. JCM 19037]GAK03913.1 type I restriction-modification system, specificity subunit S [Geomicrobium sp. JCM 19037]